MKSKSNFEVVVGNIGSVLFGTSATVAKKTYAEYVRLSKADYGRAAGEPVTMSKDGEIEKEYAGTLNSEQ